MCASRGVSGRSSRFVAMTATRSARSIRVSERLDPSEQPVRGAEVVDEPHRAGLLHRDERARRKEPQRDRRRDEAGEPLGRTPRRRVAELVVDEPQARALGADAPVARQRQVDAAANGVAVQHRHRGHVDRGDPVERGRAAPRDLRAGQPGDRDSRSAPAEKIRLPAPVIAISRTPSSAASSSTAAASSSSVSSESVFSGVPPRIVRSAEAAPDGPLDRRRAAGGRRLADHLEKLRLRHPPVALDAAGAGQVVELVEERLHHSRIASCRSREKRWIESMNRTRLQRVQRTSECVRAPSAK